MNDLGDLNEICDIKPFDEIYLPSDDEEQMPQISDVCSLRNDALPEASRVIYNRAYNDFKKWQKKKNVTTISEQLLLDYFTEMSVTQKPTTLWTIYSMLKRTIQLNLNMDVSSYSQVLAFLKETSSGYEPVKSKYFTLEEVVKFVVEAPDDVWLDVKVVCIFGVCGSLKTCKIRSTKFADVEVLGEVILVRVEDSNTDRLYRSFTITGKFCNTVKKYIALRPPNAPFDRFFLNYLREKCTIQPIGEHKFSRMPYRIAEYLKLPETERYTGAAFKLSGQAILKNPSQTINRQTIDDIAQNFTPCPSSNNARPVSRNDDDAYALDDLGDLKEIGETTPFDVSMYLPSDDEEQMPTNDTLPEASRVIYNRAYNDFKKWQKKKNVTTISEQLLLDYFTEISVTQKPTSLWAIYSMLKRTIQLNLNMNISSYSQVLAFLKETSSGYEPVKSKYFTLEEVVKFVVEAPDDVWLDVKVACIFGVCGSLKICEFRSTKYSDVEVLGEVILVRVEDSNTDRLYRSFTITGKFCNTVKKYIALRPPHAPYDRFFLNYLREKCTIQPIGKNKFSRMPYRIAEYLKLPETERYTGGAFKLSGQAILKNPSQTINRQTIDDIAQNFTPCSSSNNARPASRNDDDAYAMDDLGDLKEIGETTPFDVSMYLSSDDEEQMPQISGVCSIRNDALPEASKEKYNRVYNDFNKWQKKKNVTTISEQLLLDYFTEMSVTQKPTSLWAIYSMLKRTIQLNLNMDVSSYSQVLAFLKETSSGYEPVKSKYFTLEEVVKFVVEAPDDVWLDVKVVCIFGVCGSLKTYELRSTKYADVEVFGELILVRVEDSNTDRLYRSFTITGEFCNTVKKYIALRPPHAPYDRFFVNYQREKCTIQPIGKNKFSRMPYRIAEYLKLPETERYTGAAFKLSGQAILKNPSQTIDRRMIDDIAQNLTPYPSCNNARPVSRNDDDAAYIDTQGTVIKQECEEVNADSDDSAENWLKVDNLRLHCTVCDTHLGCSVVNEGNIRTHPLLFVTQCQDCHLYYNRRDFQKGTNGKELQCRWCAQGGEVYSCSKCPYVFCRKCILQNLSKNAIAEVERNVEWRCFSCAPSAISHLRAQHRALTNHLRQAKAQLREMKNSDQLYDSMYQDVTLCCKGKEPLNAHQNPKDKRRRGDNDINCSAPESKRIRNHSTVCVSSQSPTLPIVNAKSITPPPLIIRQIVSSSTEPPPLTLLPMHSSTSQHPTILPEVIDLPLSSPAVQQMAVLPNNQLSSVAQIASSGYQTFNIGEDTFVRLPNGKLIQVGPQTAITAPTQQVTLQQTAPVLIPNNLWTMVTNPTPTAQIINQPSQIVNVNQPLQQNQQYRQSAVVVEHQQTPLQQQSFQPSLQMIEVGQQNQISQPPPPQQRQNSLPSQPSSQRRSNIPLAKAQPPTPSSSNAYPNTPLAQAQTVFEKEVYSVQDICQQIVGKCNALMKSNAYKSVQSLGNVRDLHQHLAYLCKYASDRFDTLKEKCTDSIEALKLAEVVESLAAGDNCTNVDDDDVQVLEPVTEYIEIDSDNEAEPAETSPEIMKEQIENLNRQIKSNGGMNLQTATDVVQTTDKLELPTPFLVLQSKESAYDHYDEKLNGTAVVTLEKDGNIERMLEELLERQNFEDGNTRSPLNQVVDVAGLDTEMASNNGDKNDPLDEDYQIKVETEIEITESNECEQFSYKELSDNVIKVSSENISSPDTFDDLTGNKTAGYKCEVCGRSFARKQAFNSHKWLHHGKSPHTCSTCGKSFTRNGNLKVHEKNRLCKIFRPTTLACVYCSKTFSRKVDLMGHISIIHTKEPINKCIYCEKLFTRKAHLVVHTRSHTGETPFKCEICGKSFARKQSLSDHKWLHSANSPHTCSTCGKSYARKSFLKAHERKHHKIIRSTFACVYCSKMFSCKEDLMAHISNIHTKKESSPRLTEEAHPDLV